MAKKLKKRKSVARQPTIAVAETAPLPAARQPRTLEAVAGTDFLGGLELIDSPSEIKANEEIYVLYKSKFVHHAPVKGRETVYVRSVTEGGIELNISLNEYHFLRRKVHGA